MRLVSTLSVLTLIVLLASCSKSPAPSTSFVATKYLGIDHMYTSKGLEQEGTAYVIHGDETGSTNKLKITLTDVKKGNYAMTATGTNEVVYMIDRATYSTRPRGANCSLTINKIDSTIFNIHGTYSGKLINVSDSSDYLEMYGEVNVKYQY